MGPMDMTSILDCALTQWSPGIGDPSVVGWLTVAAYAVAAVLAFRTTGGAGAADRAERLFWTLAGLYLAALAVNKQLDLQSLMTAIGRCSAQEQGWYAMRRGVQVGVILGLVGASVAGGLVAFWTLRRTLGRTWLALLGLVWITGFVLVRAVGFHHVDRLIGFSVGGIRLNWAFELGGIGLFVLGTLLARAAYARRGRRDPL